MITSVPCRLSVAGCPGAGVPVDLACHKGRAAHCGGAVTITKVRGGTINPRSLQQRTAGSRRQANSSGDIAATAMPMQGQANCPLNELPDPGEQQRRSRRNCYC